MLAGALLDVTGSYVYPFYAAGICIFISGLVCFPLRKFAEIERRSRGGLLPPSHNSSGEEVKEETTLNMSPLHNHSSESPL